MEKESRPCRYRRRDGNHERPVRVTTRKYVTCSCYHALDRFAPLIVDVVKSIARDFSVPISTTNYFGISTSREYLHFEDVNVHMYGITEIRVNVSFNAREYGYVVLKIASITQMTVARMRSPIKNRVNASTRVFARTSAIISIVTKIIIVRNYNRSLSS